MRCFTQRIHCNLSDPFLAQTVRGVQSRTLKRMPNSGENDRVGYFHWLKNEGHDKEISFPRHRTNKH